jgi:hypothetical protein
MKVMKIMGSMIVNNLKYTTLLGPLKMRGKKMMLKITKLYFIFTLDLSNVK